MNHSLEFSPFADAIRLQKYSFTKEDGTKESWTETARRVVTSVMSTVEATESLVEELIQLVTDRVFIPGGRYLSSAGREYHQTQNCLLLSVEDSREGWAELLKKSSTALMTGAGIGIEYSSIRPEGSPIRRTGGVATGPLALMQMVNECGRGIRQGGTRRSAIWAGLNWQHPDIFKFITMKDWPEEVKALKEKDFNFPATMDGTNISVGLDDEFFWAYKDVTHPLNQRAHEVYWQTVRHMLESAEPGFSVNLGKDSQEILRNAPVCADTMVMTLNGYKPVSQLLGSPQRLWTGYQWSPEVVFSKTKVNVPIVRVSMTGGRDIRCDESHPFFVVKYKGAGKKRKVVDVLKVPANKLKPGDVLKVALSGTYAVSCTQVEDYYLGYVYGDGSFTQAGGAEATFCTEESKECSKEVHLHSKFSSVNKCDGRGYTRVYFSVDEYWKGRSKDIFPVEMYSKSPHECASFLAGLFDSDGNWEESQKRIRLASKHEGFLRGVGRLLEQYGILSCVSKAGHSTYGQSQTYQLVVMSDFVQRFISFVPTIRLKMNADGYKSYRKSEIKVISVEEDGFEDVYCTDVQVPEHSFQAEGVIISNCTEVSSADDSDICNLGSINMARINSLQEMDRAVELGTMFLLAGTVYSDVPYEKVGEVREKNRRLGLGLMGLHEWMLKRGQRYWMSDELETYMRIYEKSTEYASRYARVFGISEPIKTRAIAPTGTIGIIGETSTGCEPLFCVAYKRRYLSDGTVWKYQYVLDPTAKRLIESGVKPEDVEDAYILAEEPERRIAFQAWLQKFVDHGISSTINLPAWGTEFNNEDRVKPFGDMLMRYLPSLRGITCYPDGARSGQPISTVKYSTAMKHEGDVFVEAADICDISKGGSCGS